MELEVNDMKVLGAIKRGASGLRSIKNVVHLKNEELEKILDVLDQSKMITIRYGSGLLGQKKVMLGVTENGIKEIQICGEAVTVMEANLFPDAGKARKF